VLLSYICPSLESQVHQRKPKVKSPGLQALLDTHYPDCYSHVETAVEGDKLLW
jgi:hypothetical protein